MDYFYSSCISHVQEILKHNVISLNNSLNMGRSFLKPTDPRTQKPQRGWVPSCSAFTVHRHLDLNAM